MTFKFKKILLICYSMFIFIFGVISTSGLILNFIYNRNTINRVIPLFIYTAVTIGCIDIVLWIRYIRIFVLIKRLYFIFMLYSIAKLEVINIINSREKLNIILAIVIICFSIGIFVIPTIIKIIRLNDDYIYLD